MVIIQEKGFLSITTILFIFASSDENAVLARAFEEHRESPGNAERFSGSRVAKSGVREGEERLRIDSSVIGMDSARSYQASKITVRRFAVMDYQRSLPEYPSEAPKIQRSPIFSNTRFAIFLICCLPKEEGDCLTANMRVFRYSQETIQMEAERTSFSTVGTVKTSDGREISFNVNVGMSREFQQSYSENLDLVSFTMCDPLVINLDTDVAELADQNFYFDIDADGEKDEIAQLAGGSGYLALDKNNDGTINDGSELFGTKSGDVLYRLSDRGVGAICLQNAATDFTLQSGSGNTKGAIRKTGIFLYENGNVGTVQHVDVAKYYNQA